MRKIQIVTTTEIITVDIEDGDVYKWINAIEQNEAFRYVDEKENEWIMCKKDIKLYTITMGDDEQ